MGRSHQALRKGRELYVKEATHTKTLVPEEVKKYKRTRTKKSIKEKIKPTFFNLMNNIEK